MGWCGVLTATFLFRDLNYSSDYHITYHFLKDEFVVFSDIMTDGDYKVRSAHV